MAHRFVIRRLSKLTVGVLAVCVYLPMIFWAVWFNLWRDTLSCEHVAEGVRCSVSSNGPGGDRHPVMAKNAQRAEIENRVSHTGSRSSVSTNAVITTPTGPVLLSIPVFSTLTPGGRREVIDALDAFVQSPSSPVFTKVLTPGLPVRLMISALGLLGILAAYAMAWNTLLEVDSNRNLVIKRRTWRFVRETLQTPLDTVKGVELGARTRRRIELLLHRQSGEPIELGPISWLMSGTTLAAVRAFIEAERKG